MILVQGNNGLVIGSQKCARSTLDCSMLQDCHLLDKLAHFDRERIPPRVVYAKGTGAHGYFEVTDDFSAITKAKFLNRVGKRTPIFVRFSNMVGERGSADTVRDVKGFAVKFYTEEGNWDLCGSNSPAFFIRNPLQYPDLIHSQKRNPQTNLYDSDSYWEFLSHVPEALHQVVHLFADRGIPDGYSHMNGYSGHTFKLVNAKGEFKYCKFHFKSDQGIKNLDDATASKLAGTEPDYCTRELQNRISASRYPSWTVYFQIMEPESAATYRWNVFDVTKAWPHKDYPLQRIGRIVLNRNPDNYFAEVEQSSFSPSSLVPGIEVTGDKLLQGRLFACADAARYRLGGNYMQIPINTPYMTRVSNDYRDGVMNVKGGGQLKSTNTPTAVANEESSRLLDGKILGYFPVIASDEDLVQPGEFWRHVLDKEEKLRVVNRLVDSLSRTRKSIRERMVAIMSKADKEWGEQVRKSLDLLGPNL